MFSWHGWPLNTASLCGWRRHKSGKEPKRESGLGRVGKDSLSIYAYCPPPLPPPSTLPFLRYQILEYVWDLYETCNWDICTSIFIRFAGFDAVTLANNHLNDFGEKGANFTFEVLKKTGVKYIGVTYGEYDTSQVSITCSDIQHWHKPEMLPIFCKTPSKTLFILGRDFLFCFHDSMWSTRLPNFCLEGLGSPCSPPPLPPDLCSAAYVLVYWKFPLRTWLQNSSDFYTGSERAPASRQSKGLDWG